MENKRTIITETFVQNSVINYLKDNKWSSNLVSKDLKSHGVDIKVRNDKFSRYWLIEVKGDPGINVKSP